MTTRAARAAAASVLVVGLVGCAAQQPNALDDVHRDEVTAVEDDALLAVQAPARAGLGGFGALPAAVASEDVIVPECRPKYDAPPYQIGAVGSFSGGQVQVLPGVKVSAISGRFCAVATVVNAPPDTHPDATVCAELVAPANGLQFDDVSTELNLIRGVTSIIGQVRVVPEALTAFICDDGTPGELRLDTTILASAVPEVFGTSCLVGPLRATVTGTFSGSLKEATARLSSGTFPVSAVQPSEGCPEGLARNTNEILGLPLAASVGGLTIETVAALYLPAAP